MTRSDTDPPWPDLGVAPHVPEEPMADVPRSYTPLCAQCGKWFLLAQRMERERDDAHRKLEALRKGLIQYEHTVQAIEAERDEARAEAHDATVLLIHRTRERDEARAEVAIRQTGALPPLEHLLCENERLVALMREVRQSGVEHDAPSVGYVTVQMDRQTWADLAAALEGRDE